MKKYFLKDSKEEVKMGDIVALNFEDKNKQGDIKHVYLEVKVTPLMLEMLIDEGIIVTENKEDKTEGIKFNIDNNTKNTDKDIKATLDDLNQRLTELEGIVANMYDE